MSDLRKVRQLVDEGFVAIIGEMPGFVAFYRLDAVSGVIASTSVFEYKDAEERSNIEPREFVAKYLAPLMPNPPQVTAGEVGVYRATS